MTRGWGGFSSNNGQKAQGASAVQYFACSAPSAADGSSHPGRQFPVSPDQRQTNRLHSFFRNRRRHSGRVTTPET